jgi:predicted nucleic acid-binding protein
LDYLADTNILLRFAQRTHPLHAVTRHAVRTLRANGDTIHATIQNFVEFWNVATRPVSRNGFGLTPDDTDHLLRLVERLFPRLPDAPGLYPEWRRLVVQYRVSGVQVHDARLVAAMNSSTITHILTFNTVDFARYASEGIVAIDPASI